ncbi:hypothetical protein E2562_002017 [Oryza meyeriana var. granulata]|uniref:Uncharacterized protein n=1 Tax=Oryza meyeriana var. granulata TaxID=110450 RepID=A0A6G1C3B9_9ORYZ|nr:hypothetical protein E2562_002017 [Oryza meyeriana var. granulata]
MSSQDVIRIVETGLFAEYRAATEKTLEAHVIVLSMPQLRSARIFLAATALFHPGAVTAPAPYRRCCVTAPALCSHAAVAAPRLCSPAAIATSRHLYSVATPSSPHLHSTATPPPLHCTLQPCRRRRCCNVDRGCYAPKRQIMSHMSSPNISDSSWMLTI